MMPIVVGHRGASGLVLENTILSFQKAIALDIEMVELDVQDTSDGEIVVFHDFDLSRLTGEPFLINDLELREISEIKLAGGLSIPTLKEVLELCHGRIDVNIEIKKPGIENECLEIVRSKGMMDHVIFSSFFQASLNDIRAYDSDIAIGVLIQKIDESYLDYCREIHATSINPPHDILDEENLSRLLSLGIQVLPWTVNEPERIEYLYKSGVHGIISDYPDVTKTIRDALFR